MLKIYKGAFIEVKLMMKQENGKYALVLRMHMSNPGSGNVVMFTSGP